MTTGAGPAEYPKEENSLAGQNSWEMLAPSTPVQDHTTDLENTSKAVQTKVFQADSCIQLHQRTTSKPCKSRMRVTSSNFGSLRRSGGHPQINGQSRTFPKRDVCCSKEGALDQGGEITHVFLQLIRGRRPRWIVLVRSLQKMDPFHDRQPATSCFETLPQCSEHSYLPVFPNEAGSDYPGWKNILRKALRELYVLFGCNKTSGNDNENSLNSI